MNMKIGTIGRCSECGAEVGRDDPKIGALCSLSYQLPADPVAEAIAKEKGEKYTPKIRSCQGIYIRRRIEKVEEV